MRDTTKPIPGLDAETEKQRGFERVHADLNKPDTVASAVKSTGAKYAFFYLAFGAPDHMRATAEALKSAGIKEAVFLSSFTVHGNLRDIEPSDMIPYAHAQVELVLQDVFGEHFIALRPGSFASNEIQYKEGLQANDVKIAFPRLAGDGIVPEDIGRVAGTILAQGPKDDKKAITLYGPEIHSPAEIVKILSKVLGKDPKVSEATEAEARQILTEVRKLPPPLVEYFLKQANKPLPEDKTHILGYLVEDEEFGNVEKYSGQRSTTFEEWATQNKHLFEV